MRFDHPLRKLSTLLHCLGGAVVLVVCLGSIEASAQGQWEKEGEGEIKDVEIEIVKDRKITLPRANRNFDKVPPRAFEPIKPAIQYEFTNFKFNVKDFKPVVRPLKLKQEELPKIYGNYLSGGLGNYGSVFLEGSLTTKRDKNKFLGAHFVSRSFASGPVDGKNSASSNAQLDLFGKSMGKDLTFSGEAHIESRRGYFYGYNPVVEVDRDLIRQTYSVYSVRAGIENTKSGDFSYSLSGGYSYLQDLYRASEGEASLRFNSTYKINETSNFQLSADYFLITRSDSLITNSTRHLFRIKPSYQFTPIDKLLVTAGVNIAVQNDQYPGSKDLHLYPHLKAQFALSDSWEAYGIVTGDVDKVDLHSLAAENMWIDSNIPITHTNRALEFLGGLTGKLGRKVAVAGGLSIASLKNYYYYQTVRDNLNPGGVPVGVLFDKFTTVYDNNTQRFNPFAEISYAAASPFRMTLRGDYFKYTTDVLQEAWHRPSYRLNAQLGYNLYDKISLESGLIMQGGMKSLDPGTNTIIELDPAVDLNIKARYFLSKQISAFVQCNNILSNKYPVYQSYSVRGFQLLAGVSWSF